MVQLKQVKSGWPVGGRPPFWVAKAGFYSATVALLLVVDVDVDHALPLALVTVGGRAVRVAKVGVHSATIARFALDVDHALHLALPAVGDGRPKDQIGGNFAIILSPEQSLNPTFLLQNVFARTKLSRRESYL